MAKKRKSAKHGKAKGKRVLKAGQAVTFNVSVPKSMLKKIDLAANKKEMSRSAYVRSQIRF